MCDKRDIGLIRSIFPEYNCVTFDFRAHGEDKEDQVCTFGRDEAHDVYGVVKYIKSDPDLKDLPLFLWSFSMGAVASILAQEKYGNLFDAGVYDCPFESSQDLLKRGLDKVKLNFFGYEFDMPGKWILQKYAYNEKMQSVLKFFLKYVARMDATKINTLICPIFTVEAAKFIKSPALFIGCKNDDKAPVQAVKKVYDNVSVFKRLWLTNGRGHCDSIFNSPEEYAYRINRFYKKVLYKTYNAKVTQKIVEDRPEDDLI